MLRMFLALLLLLCLPLSLEAKPRQGKKKQVETEKQSRTLPPWPFEQNQREVGVQYRERVVSLNDDTTREWTVLVPFRSSPRMVTDLSGNVVAVQPSSGGYTEETIQGKVIAATETKVCVAALGREGRFWQDKAKLSEDSFAHLYRLELEAAIQLEEPRAKELQERFETANRKQGAVAPVASQQELRTWTDATGRHSMQAAFAGVIAGKVRLRKEDGQVIELTMEKLSQEDQDWILGKR